MQTDSQASNNNNQVVIPAELPMPNVEKEEEILGRLLEHRAEKTNIVLSARSILQGIVRNVREYMSVRTGIVSQLETDEIGRIQQKGSTETAIENIDAEILGVTAEVGGLREAFHVSAGKAGLTCSEETTEAVRGAACRSFGADRAPEEPKDAPMADYHSSLWDRIREFALPLAPGMVFAISGGTVFGLISPSEIMNLQWPPSGRLVVMLMVGWLMTVYISRSVKKATREYIKGKMPVDLDGRKEHSGVGFLLASFGPAFAELIIDALGFCQLWLIRSRRMERMTGHPAEHVPFIVFMVFGLAAAFGYFLYIFNTERSKVADEQRFAIASFDKRKKYEAELAKHQQRVGDAELYLRNNPNAQDALAKAGLLAPAVKRLMDLEGRRTELLSLLDKLRLPCQPNHAMIAQLGIIRGKYEDSCKRFDAAIESLDEGQLGVTIERLFTNK